MMKKLAVSAALAASGVRPVVPSGYGLRNLDIAQWLPLARESGLVPAPGGICPGEVLLIGLPHCQHHLQRPECAQQPLRQRAGRSAGTGG